MPAHNLIHGGDVYTAMENGLERPLDFSANIGPLGLPPAVAEAARRAVGSCDTYPDPLCRRLTAALAWKRKGCRRTGSPAATGAAELLFRFAGALRPKKALLLAPALPSTNRRWRLPAVKSFSTPCGGRTGFCPPPRCWRP